MRRVYFESRCHVVEFHGLPCRLFACVGRVLTGKNAVGVPHRHRRPCGMSTIQLAVIDVIQDYSINFTTMRVLNLLISASVQRPNAINISCEDSDAPFLTPCEKNDHFNDILCQLANKLSPEDNRRALLPITNVIGVDDHTILYQAEE